MARLDKIIVNGWSIHVEQDENDFLFYYRLHGQKTVSELEAGAGFDTEAEAYTEAIQEANKGENGGYDDDYTLLQMQQIAADDDSKETGAAIRRQMISMGLIKP